MGRIFDQTPEWGGSKVNFVDDYNVLLGYDMYQDCCETAFWRISDKEKFEDGDEKEGNDFDLDRYHFDTEYLEEYEPVGELWVATFRLVGSKWGTRLPDLYVHLCNSHNGYYSHGFTFSTPTKHGDL